MDTRGICEADAAADADVEVQRIMSAGRNRRCSCCGDVMLTRRKFAFLHLLDDDEVCDAGKRGRSNFSGDVVNSQTRIAAGDSLFFSQRCRTPSLAADRTETGKDKSMAEATHVVTVDSALRVVEAEAVMNAERNRPSLSLEKMQVVNVCGSTSFDCMYLD